MSLYSYRSNSRTNKYKVNARSPSLGKCKLVNVTSRRLAIVIVEARCFDSKGARMNMKPRAAIIFKNLKRSWVRQFTFLGAHVFKMSLVYTVNLNDLGYLSKGQNGLILAIYQTRKILFDHISRHREES